MRSLRLLTAGLLLCLLAGAASAAPARVQGKVTTTPCTGLTCALAFTAPVTSGSMVLGSVSYDTGGGETIASITDDKGNAYDVIDNVNDSAQVQSYASFTSHTTVTNAPTTITVTFSLTQPGPFVWILLDEYSGLATSGAVEAHSMQLQTAPTTAANAVTSPAISTISNGDLIYGVTTANAQNADTFTAGATYTLRTSNNGTVGQNILASEDRIQSTSAQTAATFTININDRAITGVIALKAATTTNSVSSLASRGSYGGGGTGGGGGGGCSSFPLPLVSNTATDGYSLRKLVSTYNGKAINVRRASDSAIQDIGFVGCDLDTTALAALCNATSCFVTTFYDQVGATNLVQATAALQPQILLNQTGNNKAALSFTAGQQLTGTAGSAAAQPITMNAYFNRNVGQGAFGDVITLGTTPITGSMAIFSTPSNGVGCAQPGSNNLTVTNTAVPDGAWHAATCIANGGGSSIWVDGVQTAGTIAADNPNTGLISLGHDNNDFLGRLPEVIAFSTVPSSGNVSTLLANQQSYFGTTVPPPSGTCIAGTPLNITSAPYNAVGDGTTDNTAAINQALVDGANSGRPVLVPAGNFARAGILNMNGTVQELYGTGAASIMTELAGADKRILMTGSRVSLHDLRNISHEVRTNVYSGGVYVTANRFMVQNIIMNNVTPGSNLGGGMALDGAANGKVFSNLLEWTNADAIQSFASANNNELAWNRINSPGDDGLSNNSYSSGLNSAPHDNYFHDNSIYQYTTARGLECIACYNTRFDHNHVEAVNGQSGAAGMYLVSENNFGGGDIQNVSVTNNTFKFNGGGHNPVLVGNFANSPGIVSQITVTGNQMYQPQASFFGTVTDNGHGGNITVTNIANNTQYSANGTVVTNNAGATIQAQSNNTDQTVASYPGDNVPLGGGPGSVTALQCP